MKNIMKLITTNKWNIAKYTGKTILFCARWLVITAITLYLAVAVYPFFLVGYRLL